MATNKELEARLAQLEALLKSHGLQAPPKVAVKPEDRADYIAFGSPEHATFLGLIEVEDMERAEELGYFAYRSSETEQAYRLEDQITAYINFPDPAQVARLVLIQKVNSLESGVPQVPETAPAMWVPRDVLP